MTFTKRNAAWLLALALLFTAVLPLMGDQGALAWTDPKLVRVSGGDGMYYDGEVIDIVYKYTPNYRKETTVCKLFDEDGKELAETKHVWTNSSRSSINWKVKFDTEKYPLAPGTYHVQAFIYYWNDAAQSYLSVSYCDSWFTILENRSRGVYLDQEEYTYVIPYGKTTVPKKAIRLYATMVGISGKVKWSTTDSTVARVSNKGKVVMRGLGTALIYAKVGAYSDSCEINVERQDPMDFYAEDVEPLFNAIDTAFGTAFDSKTQMKASFNEIFKKAMALRTLIKKTRGLKTDASAKNLATKLYTYARKAKLRAAKSTVDVDDELMDSYASLIEDYSIDLNDRLLTLLDQ